MCPKLYIVLLALAMLCARIPTTDSRKVIFFNNENTIKTSNLLITVQRSKPCDNGMKRDHNNRCRRVVTFLRKRRS